MRKALGNGGFSHFQKGREAMTDKQKRFCEEYLIDLNATQAAIRAGYKPRSAGSVGSENLEKPEIRACVDQMLADRSARTGVNADRVVRELAKIAFAKGTDVIDTETGNVREDATDDDRACIAAVKVKQVNGADFTSIEHEIRLCDKVKALELLGKHLGIFEDNINVDVSGAVKIVDDIGD